MHGSRLFPANLLRRLVHERLHIAPDEIAAGHCVACVVLRPPFTTCRRRLSERDDTELPDVAVLERLWSEFSDLGPLEGHAIDNGRSAPEETVREVMVRLRDGTLEI